MVQQKTCVYLIPQRIGMATRYALIDVIKTDLGLSYRSLLHLHKFTCTVQGGVTMH